MNDDDDVGKKRSLFLSVLQNIFTFWPLLCGSSSRCVDVVVVVVAAVVAAVAAFVALSTEPPARCPGKKSGPNFFISSVGFPERC